MNDFFNRLPEQAVRIVVLFILVAGVLFVVRQFVIPPELKDNELQKTYAMEREANRAVKYAGGQACAECHDDKKDLKQKGYHRDLSCESCHGEAQKHVENPTDLKPTSPRKRDYCSYCHTYNSSRPTGFPQINPQTHNPRKPCITCHNPHDPTPPSVPSSCAACHAQIERTKVASYHAVLDCTVCHKTPEKHKTSPRVIRPSKPDTREFCGTCHNTQSPRKGVPAIDLATHGEKYVCWQCHYPHMLGGI